MSYIGQQPTVGNFQICDAISVVDGQAAYTMQVASVNVVPETANHMIVSLNGVIQKPNSSFTISGSTITFASNLVTGDVINFIQILGSVLNVGTVSDATITDAKANFVSTSSAAGLQIKGDGTTDGTLQLNCSQNSHGIKIKSPPHSAGASYTLTMPNNDGDANQVLTTDGSGVLSFAAAGGGKVLQVLTATDSTARSTTSTSFVTASNTLSVDITPSATSSKIFITASFETGTSSGSRGFWTIYKDSTNLGAANGMFSSSAGSVATDGMSGSLTFLDSPSSTSELTYAVYMKSNATSCNMNANTVKGSIVVMEIGA